MLTAEFKSAIEASAIRVTELGVSSEQARIRILISRAILYTSELPGFDRRLLQRLPSLCSTICHNDFDLPFAEELRATEMGHVFEHVVLAILIQHGIYARGVTEWNWHRDPEGTFTITLSGGELEEAAVEVAITEAVTLIGELLHVRAGGR